MSVEANFLALFCVPVLVLCQNVMPSFVKWIVSATNSEFPEERQIDDEIRELRREQAEISLKDNFAQHAKKERKILKLKEDLKKYGSLHTASMASASRAFNITFYSLLSLCTFLLFWNCGFEPLIKFKDPSVLYPLGWFISLPSGVPGAVGFPFWMFCSRTFVKGMRKMF